MLVTAWPEMEIALRLTIPIFFQMCFCFFCILSCFDSTCKVSMLLSVPPQWYFLIPLASTMSDFVENFKSALLTYQTSQNIDRHSFTNLTTQLYTYLSTSRPPSIGRVIRHQPEGGVDPGCERQFYSWQCKILKMESSMQITSGKKHIEWNLTPGFHATISEKTYSLFCCKTNFQSLCLKLKLPSVFKLAP